MFFQLRATKPHEPSGTTVSGFQVLRLLSPCGSYIRLDDVRESCNRFTVPVRLPYFRFQTLDDEAATTLYAASGRLIPFNSNSPTGSTVTAFSTFISTRGLMRI